MHNRHVSTITALTLSASLLTACGGGGGGTSPIPSKPGPTPNGKTQTAITFSIPGKKSNAFKKAAVKGAPRTGHAAPQGYASRSVQSLAISFAAHGTALPAVNAAPTYASNVSPGKNDNNTTCTSADPASGAYSCTVLIAAPVGFDDIAISEWDAANGAEGATPNAPSGNVLAIWNSLNDAAYAGGVAIQQNQLNTPDVEMHGVVHSAQTTLTTTSMVSGTAGATTVGVTALDADGNVITGNLQYVDNTGANVTLTVTGSPNCTVAKPCSPTGGVIGPADPTDFSILTAAFNTPQDTAIVNYTATSGNSLANVTFSLTTGSPNVPGSLNGATLEFTQTNSGGITVGGAPQATLIGGGTCLWDNNPSDAILGADGAVYVNDDAGYGNGGFIDQITANGDCSNASEGNTVSWIGKGADGDVWYVDNRANVVGKFSPAEFTGVAQNILSGPPGGQLPNDAAHVTAPIAPIGQLHNVAAGADGKMYVTDDGGQLVIVNPQDMSVRTASTSGAVPVGIAKGPSIGGHGTIWWTDEANLNNGVGYMDISTQSVTRLQIFRALQQPTDIIEGPDGMMYVALSSNQIAVVDPSLGASNPVHTYSLSATPSQLAIGPDKNVWFGESNGDLGRLTIAQGASAAVLSEFGSNSNLSLCGSINGVTAASGGTLFANDSCGSAYSLALP